MKWQLVALTVEHTGKRPARETFQYPPVQTRPSYVLLVSSATRRTLALELRNADLCLIFRFVYQLDLFCCGLLE